jgi:solute carrier family 25 (mitochondrial uncoupling protein), member 8/9
MIFSGIRVGSYQSVKELVCGPLEEGQNPLLYQKIIAAMITGAIGITVANPTDVVKVRLQNQTK